jgi:hypothetical protein
MTRDPIGDALAVALNYLPDRDALLDDIQRAAVHQLAHADSVAYADALFALRERQAAKAIELGLIPQAELDRVMRTSSARSALAELLSNKLNRAE